MPDGRTYYNEHDAFAVAWLRGLIGERALPAGDVDARDIRLVQPAELARFDTCHFFAGIGGWAYALQLAGWPADRPVWTGSCPCQPFSSAGKGEGFDDPRHLWPTWFRLIRECRPAVVFGEQVASAAGLAWFDHVSADLEGEGYAVGAADLPAASVGAPHIRQRLFFVAYTGGGRIQPARPGLDRTPSAAASPEDQRERLRPDVGDGGDARGLADTNARGRRLAGESELRQQAALGNAELGIAPCAVGDASSDGRERGGLEEHGDERSASGLLADGSGARGPWDGAQPILCGDGKVRLVPTERALFPLASGLPNRVGILRGSGNAIVPQVAAEFIRAFLEAEQGLMGDHAR